MRYEVLWEAEALAAAQRFMTDDPGGLRAVFETVDDLAQDPRPGAARPWGGDHLRLRVGRYRVLYHVADDVVTVSVIHLGRS